MLLQSSCRTIDLDRKNLACDAGGACLDGWFCDTELGICVLEGDCVLGSVTTCASCTDDCTATVVNANAICNTTGARNVCDYEGNCSTGYVDADLYHSNGCESLCSPTNGGVETCDGLDNDCNGAVDDVIDVDTDCNAQLGDVHVTSWACSAGSCTVVHCENDFWDNNASGADGCEHSCTQTNDGVETCNGEDEDCNGVIDDVIDINADCRDPLADSQPEVAQFACESGSCSIELCNAGFLDNNLDAQDGCEAACITTNDGVEKCDGTDNDCDGAVDNAEQGAEGCTDFYLDDDNDELGVDDDTQCWCSPTGHYRASVGGDCDDSVATCTEDCTTDADSDGTADCAATCRDRDGDGCGRAGSAG